MIISETVTNPYETMLQAYNPRRRYDDEMTSIDNKMATHSASNLLDEVMKEAGIGQNVDLEL